MKERYEFRGQGTRSRNETSASTPPRALSSGSEEFRLVTQAIKVLEEQRRIALQDLSTIEKHRQTILSDPIRYITKLRDGNGISFPPPQKVISIPTLKRDPGRLRPKAPMKEMTPTPKMGVSWTKKDIQLLKNLMKAFPEEANPEERYIKIARAMGNKTVKQVENRVLQLQAQDDDIILPGYSSQILSANKRIGDKRPPNSDHQTSGTFHGKRFAATSAATSRSPSSTSSSTKSGEPALTYSVYTLSSSSISPATSPLRI